MNQLNLFTMETTKENLMISWERVNPLVWEFQLGWLKLSIVDDLGFYCLIANREEIFTADSFEEADKKAKTLIAELKKALGIK